MATDTPEDNDGESTPEQAEQAETSETSQAHWRMRITGQRPGNSHPRNPRPRKGTAQ